MSETQMDHVGTVRASISPPVCSTVLKIAENASIEIMASPIQIPDNAPFSPEQRVWLSEFLGKMLVPLAVPLPLLVHLSPSPFFSVHKRELPRALLRNL